MASLWEVSDRSTMEMIQHFYSHLFKHDKDEALRLAMLEMLQTEKFSDPYYWAGFNVYGAEGRQ